MPTASLSRPGRPAHGSPRPSLDEPWPSLREAYLAFRRRWAELLSPCDLSLSEFGVLELCSRGPAKASAVAQAIGITPAGATDLIDRLEKRRFVRRVAHPTDRRAVLVTLTETGERLHREAKAARLAVLHDVDHALTDSERRALILGLTALLRAMPREPT